MECLESYISAEPSPDMQLTYTLRIGESSIHRGKGLVLVGFRIPRTT